MTSKTKTEVEAPVAAVPTTVATPAEVTTGADGLLSPEATATAEPVITKGLAMGVVGTGSLIPSLQADMSPEDRRTAVRQVLHEAINAGEKVKLLSGELLYEVSQNKYWQEWSFKDDTTGEERKYASFEEYGMQEHGMKRRQLFYRMSIYRDLVLELGLPADRLRDLDWSKLKELPGVITKENCEDLLSKIATMSVPKVIEMVKAMKPAKGAKAIGDAAAADSTPAEAGGTGTVAEAEAADLTRLSFKLHPAQLELVNSALAVAQSLTGSDKPGYQLEMICSEFLTTSAGSGVEGALSKLEMAIATLQRVFHVKLEVTGVDEAHYDKLKGASTAIAEVGAKTDALAEVAAAV